MFLQGRLLRSFLSVGVGLLLGSCASHPSRVPSPGSETPSAEESVISKAPGSGRVIVLYVSDLHGHLRSSDAGHGGYARLKRWIAQEKAAGAQSPNTDVLAVFGGDAFGKGAMPCRKTQEHACARLLKELGFDVGVLGNGELKRSRSELETLMRESAFPWISPNVEVTRGNAAWTGSWLYQGQRSGAAWWISGWSVPPTPGEIDLSRAGYRVRLEPQARDWQRWKREAAEHPLLLLSHQFLHQDEAWVDGLCAQLPPLRLLAVLRGHTHRVTQEDRSRCVPMFEPGPFGEWASRLEFAKKSADAEWKLVQQTFVEINGTWPEDPDLTQKIAELYRQVAPEADQVLAAGARPLTREQAAQWWADSFRTVTHGDVAVINEGAVKEAWRGGNMTREQMLEIYPYDNAVTGVDISVEELSRMLCAAEMRERDPRLDDGARLYWAGAELQGAGTPQCTLVAGRKKRVKLILDSYLVSRSARWLGRDLSARTFPFGMKTSRLLERALQTGGYAR